MLYDIVAAAAPTAVVWAPLVVAIVRGTKGSR